MRKNNTPKIISIYIIHITTQKKNNILLYIDNGSKKTRIWT